MERIDWIDWADALREVAEEEGFDLGCVEDYRDAWLSGKSPERAIQDAEESDEPFGCDVIED